MAENYKHNINHILMKKFLYIFWYQIQMWILRSPLHSYYLNLTLAVNRLSCFGLIFTRDIVWLLDVFIFV